MRSLRGDLLAARGTLTARLALAMVMAGAAVAQKPPSVSVLAARSDLSHDLPAAASPTGEGVRRLSAVLEGLSERAGKAVVQILAVRRTRGETEEGSASETNRQESLGSGILLSADGYILTNAHVVAGATHLKVRLTRAAAAEARERGDTGVAQTLEGKLIGIDHGTDLAVIKIEKTGLPFLAFGDSAKLKQGELIVAAGSPFGLESSVSLGVVSALARRLKTDEPMVYIQTDAPINPGNSGGPLINLDGEVVGINTYILSQSGGSEGVGFAIPSEIANPVYEQLKRNKRLRRGRMGLVGETISTPLAATLGLSRDVGVIVSDVDPDGPAEHAGIQKDDIIVSLDGRQVERLRQLELSTYVRQPGDVVKVGLLRGATQFDVELKLEEEPPGLASLADLLDPEADSVPEIGIVGLSISRAMLKWLPDLRRPQGVLVVAAEPEESYPVIGLERGDVIYEINRKVVSKVAELREALRREKDTGTAVLLVERLGHLIYVSVELN